ncbi:MAG: hypothetical protein ACXWCC_07190 [Caldimonas sp.]
MALAPPALLDPAVRLEVVPLEPLLSEPMLPPDGPPRPRLLRHVLHSSALVSAQRGFLSLS